MRLEADRRTSSPFFRKSPSNCSEWSDPGDAGVPEDPTRAVSTQGPTSSVASSALGGATEPGISIPWFLQPLLGLEFVPYIPSPEQLTIPEDHNDDVVDPFVLRAPSSSRGAKASPVYDEEEEYDDTEGELDEIDESNGRLQELTENLNLSIGLEQPSTARGGGRKSFFKRENRIFKKTIGKTFQAIKNKRLLRNEKDSPEDLEKTPKRGTRSLMRETVSSISDATPRSTWTSIDQQMQGLRSLEEKAHAVSRRAATMESRISSLTAEAKQLHQALSSVLGAIDDEAAELGSTEKELLSLNDNLKDAVKRLSQSLGTFENGIAMTTISGALSEQLSPPVFRTSLPRPRSLTGGEMEYARRSGVNLRAESFDGFSTQYKTPAPLVRRRANTEPRFSSALPSSNSFMRVGDLDLESSSSMSSSLHALDDSSLPSRLLNSECEDFSFLDQNIPLVLCGLVELGLQIATDESSRFSPASDTQKLLDSKKCLEQEPIPDWPFSPWHVAVDKDVLLWTGGVDHKGFGHDWPVVKARCRVKTSPRNLLDFLLDSSQLKKYNKMSQGREDIFVLQEGVDTTPEASIYGLSGDARIMRALNKPKFLPKTIEMLSLWYSKEVPDAPGAYMIVSRSVWENATGTPKSSNRLRSEMLLGVNLIRPAPDGRGGNSFAELTVIQHVFPQGLPEQLVKRMAPSSLANTMREIQNSFA
jgi:hypothetical protein